MDDNPAPEGATDTEATPDQPVWVRTAPWIAKEHPVTGGTRGAMARDRT